MAWIKRNLYFVVGSVVALVLMGLAGYFLYSQWAVNNQILASLNDDYEKLRRLNSAPIHPGSGQVDNIKLAKEQRDQLREFLKKPRAYFLRIPPIPDQPTLSDQDFTSALSHTLDQMQRDATNASVTLPPNYAFSFEAQRPKVRFAVGSLGPLATQLGEIKAVCDLLFQAKINSLDNIRRERVSADDNSGPQTDYLPEHSTTNELAVLTPYEMTFRSFSSELAAVLAGFTGSSNGFVIKTINVEPAPATAEATATTPYAQYVPMPSVVTAPMPQNESTAAIMARRYGIGGGGGPSMASRYGGGGGAADLGGIPLRPLQPGGQTVYPAYQTPQPQPGVASAAAANTALAPALDERQLKVTMYLIVVKLLPPK
ncbi:MAG TPA: Amuc_1100 family pilus-like protein [Candidatus Acidoferrum sp.]|jgi:hypothetical protein|nr:Amuc_1100 family pilus-like protein [Candidatus Acidoferrum sp.]